MKSLLLVPLIFFICVLKGDIHAAVTQIEISPKRQMVQVGEPVTVVCRAGERTQYCRITTPFGKVLILNPGDPPKDGYSYAGAGLENGQCGFQINNVQEQNNGIHGCYMGFSEEVSANMTIIVARPPSGMPDLKIESDTSSKTGNSGSFQENDMLRAYCEIHDSRPSANITWFLDGKQVFEGLSPLVHRPPNCNEEGSLCTSSQNLTKPVTWRDNGKRLACVMNHFAQTPGTPNQTVYQLNVQYKPHDDEALTQQYGFEIGKPGMITKQVYANPRPTFQWDIGEGVLLNEGQSSGRYRADDSVNVGHGAWNASLNIDSLTESDFQRVYQIRTTNSIGSTDFQVSISTLDKPTGAALGAGEIVGIIAAILIVLVIIFLLIFAKRTSRWCFSSSNSGKGKGSHSNSEAHIDPDIPQPTKTEVTQEDVEGGMDNPANHEGNTEYINGSDDIKKPLDSDKDTQV